MKLKLDENLNIQPLLHDKHIEREIGIFGWISYFYSMGFVN